MEKVSVSVVKEKGSICRNNKERNLIGRPKTLIHHEVGIPDFLNPALFAL